MVRRETFINKIRELGYHYKSQQAHTQLWKKSGTTGRMFVPLAKLLEDDYVTGALRQSGESDAAIKTFLAAAKA
ncbi:MAG TPA: hypothetical protein VKQ11_06650 [Candidatus Sulfotelmatobacter sp.]|nr:hypothetical protein [Candidatus Sulfotelmatobacter sp.]